ncbi:hypothetical protein KFK09_016355 [Dendrobium nobile]|uniref:Uncharacterized protein n=1 Tax=Dendrobium nobile TaxID=94219 RepID=A0A8T3AZ81_DENNO|nr:hypothetical protein KFK09_016355 [Dendrobium nobile]
MKGGELIQLLILLKNLDIYFCYFGNWESICSAASENFCNNLFNLAGSIELAYCYNKVEPAYASMCEHFRK